MYHGLPFVINPPCPLYYDYSLNNRSKFIQELCTTLHLGEAAIEEMKVHPDKTPVSILQEVLNRKGMAPTYKCIQTRGRVREPLFQYLIFLSNYFIAFGSGRSKKESKHAAAQNFLDLLVASNHPEEYDPNAPPWAPETPRTKSIPTDKVIGNPIGWLQQLCVWRNFPIPAYVTEKEEGLPHQRLFTISCKVLNYKETAIDKQKRLAKRMAAYKMWLKLTNMF